MILNSATLEALRVGFKTHFQEAFAAEKPSWEKVAERVISTSGEEKYGWLGELPGMREWIGPRVVRMLAEYDYSIKNKDFELTVVVDRNDIQDDTLGTYSTRFKTLGRAAGRKPDEMVFGALFNGFSSLCYDGQYFFDVDHPVLQADGTTASVSNTGGGAGTPWFLLATDEVIKPLIFQERKAPEFVSKDKVTDDNVFDRKQFVYGVDSRCAVGYGFWQMAYGSKQVLNAANYAAARAAIGSMKGDYGAPLGIKPNLLVVPSSLEEAGRKLLNSEYASGGETNPWKGTAELYVCPWIV